MLRIYVAFWDFNSKPFFSKYAKIGSNLQNACFSLQQTLTAQTTLKIISVFMLKKRVRLSALTTLASKSWRPLAKITNKLFKLSLNIYSVWIMKNRLSKLMKKVIYSRLVTFF